MRVADPTARDKAEALSILRAWEMQMSAPTESERVMSIAHAVANAREQTPPSSPPHATWHPRLTHETQSHLCGCCVVTFAGRCALAVPCAAHAGRIEVVFNFNKTPEPDELVECTRGCGHKGKPGSVHQCPA